MQISLLTPLFNRLDLTRVCVESVRRTLAGRDYEWILLDDGSTDGTRDFLEKLAAEDPRIRVVCNDAPRGFAANNNQGARLARAPLLCLLNNDTVPLPGWLEPMARLARLLPDVACVGNVQREPVSGLLDHAGIYFDRHGDVRHAAKDAPAPPREDYLEWPAVTAACCVVRREVFLQLGGFDEAFYNGGEDVDFCLRAAALGFRHFVANRSVIYHHISASPGRKDGEETHLRLLRERWGARLRTDLRVRRTLAEEQQTGRRYLRKHASQPWRYNVWRLGRALEQGFSPLPPTRRLDLLPRLWFAARDRWAAAGWRPPGAIDIRAPRSGHSPADSAPVFLVVGDTAQTFERAGVPTAVRKLAGAFGQIGAPVRLVTWQPMTRSLGLLPAEWSLGLDAEGLRAGLDGTAASLYDPSMGELDNVSASTPPLHDLPPGSAPPGAWILLPEVLYGGRAAQLREYAHQHGWRLAVILYDALPTNEPGVFPWGVPHEHEAYLQAIHGADLVLPVSGYTAAAWQRFVEAKALPASPTRVCVPGADTGARTTDGPANRAASAKVRMLCVSGVMPRKNHRTLLAAFERIIAARPDLQLELCLVGKPRHFNEDNVPEAVRSFTRQHPGRLIWKEWVEYSALGRYYEECDFTVFPSWLEGWGLPIVESLWYGRPCICANFGAMAETAAGGGCATVDVRDPQALADAILALADLPERRAALGAEIAARPLKRWEDYARELLGILAA